MVLGIEGSPRKSGNSHKTLGYEIVEELPVLGLFDRDIVAKQESIIEKARLAGQKLAKAIA